MAERRADALVRVASVFNAAEFAVTRSFLAAHGIVVAAEPIHLVNNYSHYATAVGGVPVLVPASQAGDAAICCARPGIPARTIKKAACDGWDISCCLAFCVASASRHRHPDV